MVDAEEKLTDTIYRAGQERRILTDTIYRVCQEIKEVFENPL